MDLITDNITELEHTHWLIGDQDSSRQQ